MLGYGKIKEFSAPTFFEKKESMELKSQVK
jgi:hypothetical protein